MEFLSISTEYRDREKRVYKSADFKLFPRHVPKAVRIWRFWRQQGVQRCDLWGRFTKNCVRGWWENHISKQAVIYLVYGLTNTVLLSNLFLVPIKDAEERQPLSTKMLTTWKKSACTWHKRKAFATLENGTHITSLALLDQAGEMRTPCGTTCQPLTRRGSWYSLQT